MASQIRVDNAVAAAESSIRLTEYFILYPCSSCSYEYSDIKVLVISELLDLDMSLYGKKIGFACALAPLFNASCADLTTLGGDFFSWVGIYRYLGVYSSSARTIKCCFDNYKASFYRSLNAIYGRLGRFASLEVIVHSLPSKCMPILLYMV